MREDQKMPNRHLLKVLSFIAALAMWFYVLGSASVEVERQVKLSFVPPVGLSVNTEVPRALKLKLRGNRLLVGGVFTQGETVVVDLQRRAEGGAQEVELSPSLLKLPFGVEVLEMVPERVSIGLEREIKKRVSVRGRFGGELPQGLALVEREIVPEKVMIKGPRSVLKRIGQLFTRPIDLSTLGGEGEGEVRVSLENEDFRVVVEEEEALALKYKIRPNQANFTLNNVNIHFLTLRNRFYSRVKRVSLDILLPEDMLTDLDEEELRQSARAIAEIPNNAQGRVRVELRAELPDGVHLLQIRPAAINISVR